ncbi:hypothetical protein QCE63_07940, partial [Caballeronia sp. LZ065]|uniref:hypothetical protein n=1 Tax=Caballeronia sp. LZ065 TaxID=3038571 RepID=UPI00285ACDB4
MASTQGGSFEVHDRSANVCPWFCLPALLWTSCIRVGLLALPLPGAGVTFFAAAKKVTKESSFLTAQGPPSDATQKHLIGPALASALKGLTGLGSRTQHDNAPLNELVQPLKALAQRYALPQGMQGKPVGGKSNEMEALANRHGQTR